MTKYSTTLTINASQEAIWKVLSDIAHWSEWSPTVTKLEVLDQPELKLDNRYKIYQPKLQPAVWTVTILQPPSNFTWESRMPGMLMIAEHILKSTGVNQAATSEIRRTSASARALCDLHQFDCSWSASSF